jgi:hypothetical protein
MDKPSVVDRRRILIDRHPGMDPPRVKSLCFR